MAAMVLAWLFRPPTRLSVALLSACVTFLPILALRFRPEPPPGVSLVGKRWATRDALRGYHWETWPPAPHVSAGTLCAPRR
jgi:hypothetical protein